MFSIVYCSLGHAQESKATLTLSPVIGISQIKTKLTGGDYYNNYITQNSSKPIFGFTVDLHSKSNWTFSSGLLFASHQMSTDSINIAPQSDSRIWSDFSLSHKSVYVPLMIGYKVGIAEKLSIRPSAGILLSSSSGHDYQESVRNPDFFSVEAATIEFTSFSVAINTSLTLDYVLSEKTTLSLSANYMRQNTLIRMVQGFENRMRLADIKHTGVFITLGLGIRLI